MAWQKPPSIKAALDEATRRWPKRSKASDGTIGDTAHSNRKSDHNPAADGDIHAFDLTHDPKNGVDCNLLAKHLVRVKDKRVKYIIWNSQICKSSNWAWNAYTGTNKHTKHMHVSIRDTTTAENDVSDWWKLERTVFSNVAIYYQKPSGDDLAFKRAATTWSQTNQPCAVYKVTTGRQFKQTWRLIAQKCEDEFTGIKNLAIFSHASKGEKLDGVEFKSTLDKLGNVVEDGTIERSEIARLEVLPWHENGLLTLHSCNSGNSGSRGWCPSREFCKAQKVDTVGMAGYSYFSKRQNVYVPIERNDQRIFLWAFRRGKNVSKTKHASIRAQEALGIYTAQSIPGVRSRKPAQAAGKKPKK